MTPKTWTTITGVLILAAVDILSWRKAWNQAKLNEEALPQFDWVMALSKWLIGGLGGNMVGTGVEAIPEA